MRTSPPVDAEGQTAEFEPQTDDEIDEMKAKMLVMEDENAKLKKLVERAFDESIRVCVVAPTVNVHFNDENSKFHSR